MRAKSHWQWAVLGLALAACVVAGCGRSNATVDAAPFQQAIAQYLESHNMAMALKEIKAGPTVKENEAQLTASLAHRDLGGPSVTWTFHFQRQADGKWTAVRHEKQ